MAQSVEGELVSYARRGQPMKFQDPDEFAELVDDYFNTCATLRDLPTITGLAVHLDTDRKTLYNYRSKDEYFPTIKRALNKCEAAIESRAMQGGLNPAMAIFSLKNNYGWVDKSEVDSNIQMVQPIIDLPKLKAVDNALPGDDSDTEDS